MSFRRSGAARAAAAPTGLGELVASGAFACGNVATSQLSPSNGIAGSRLAASGSFYNQDDLPASLAVVAAALLACVAVPVLRRAAGGRSDAPRARH